MINSIAVHRGGSEIEAMRPFGDAFRDSAPLSGADAATIILDGVRAGKWRILVGDDAEAIDGAVRADPEGIYRAGAPTVLSVLPN